MAKRRYKRRTTNRKVNNNRTSNRRYTNKKNTNKDLMVAGLIILAILLSVLIYGKAGVVGIKLNEVLGGMIGIIKYILPIGLFAIGIKIAVDDEEFMTSKLIQIAILLFSFSVLMSVFQINSKDLIIIDKELSVIVKDAYSIGASRKWWRCIRSNSCCSTC